MKRERMALGRVRYGPRRWRIAPRGVGIFLVLVAALGGSNAAELPLREVVEALFKAQPGSRLDISDRVVCTRA
jgi:hypothetical protein